MSADDRPVIRVPGDLAIEDRIAGQLTFRHLAYLAVAGGGTALTLLGSGPAARVLGVLLALAGIAGAALRPSCRPLDAWLLPLIRYRRRPRTRPEPQPAPVAPEPEPVPPVAVAEKPMEPTVRPPRQPRVPRLAAGLAAVAIGALAVAGVMRLVPSMRPAPAQPQPVWVVPVTPPSEEEVHDAIEAYVEWLLRND